MSFVERLDYVRKQLYSHVLFFFVIVTFLLLCHNYVIKTFVTANNFNDVKITSFFGTFKLRIKVTL